MRARRFALICSLLLAPTHVVYAHDAERTQVSLTFERDGSFTLDVANDPDWLLLRLESFVESPDLSASARSDGGELRRTRRSLGEGGQLGRDARLRALAPVFIDRIVLFVDGHEVRPVSAEYIAPGLSAIERRALSEVEGLPPLATYRLRGRMPPDARSLRWFYGIVIDRYPLTIHRADGQSMTEWVLGNAWSGTVDLTGQFHTPTGLETARQYLALGYLHILPRGIDHILFVIGLFLLSIRLKPILLQVTTFTVAHSITLGLTIYGIVSLPPRIVEPLIALSIAYVAVENLVTDKLKPWRLALVFSFGLLHGMGFAGVLRDLGLPRSFLTALLSFNLGVEGGQLTVIALACLCAAWYRQQHWYRRWVVTPASVLIAGVGLYWTVLRAMG